MAKGKAKTPTPRTTKPRKKPKKRRTLKIGFLKGKIRIPKRITKRKSEKRKSKAKLYLEEIKTLKPTRKKRKPKNPYKTLFETIQKTKKLPKSRQKLVKQVLSVSIRKHGKMLHAFDTSRAIRKIDKALKDLFSFQKTPQTSLTKSVKELEEERALKINNLIEEFGIKDGVITLTQALTDALKNISSLPRTTRTKTKKGEYIVLKGIGARALKSAHYTGSELSSFFEITYKNGKKEVIRVEPGKKKFIKAENVERVIPVSPRQTATRIKAEPVKEKKQKVKPKEPKPSSPLALLDYLHSQNYCPYITQYQITKTDYYETFIERNEDILLKHFLEFLKSNPNITEGDIQHAYSFLQTAPYQSWIRNPLFKEFLVYSGIATEKVFQQEGEEYGVVLRVDEYGNVVKIAGSEYRRPFYLSESDIVLEFVGYPYPYQEEMTNSLKERYSAWCENAEDGGILIITNNIHEFENYITQLSSLPEATGKSGTVRIRIAYIENISKG